MRPSARSSEIRALEFLMNRVHSPPVLSPIKERDIDIESLSFSLAHYLQLSQAEIQSKSSALAAPPPREIIEINNLPLFLSQSRRSSPPSLFSYTITTVPALPLLQPPSLFRVDDDILPYVPGRRCKRSVR